jgi:hypothetical protein
MYNSFSIQKAENGYILSAFSPVLRADSNSYIFKTLEEAFTKLKELELAGV